MMKIAVFMGGSSAERSVSLMSGQAVASALNDAGMDARSYDVQWRDVHTLFDTVDLISKDSTDLVFLALHGGLGENGGVQAILEAAGIPYTGSGITASAVAMDKDITKSLFLRNGIPTARWVAGCRDDLTSELIADMIGYPCIVKPTDQGSTMGLTLLRGPDGLEEALDTACSVSPTPMVEEYISGRELSVPVLGEEALPVIEIKPSHEIYDYECKYTPGMSSYLVPAPIDKSLTTELHDLAMRVFRTLKLRDIARIDFRLDDESRPLCFEANTIPGMTVTSLVPKSAEKAGISFPGLTAAIAEMAYNRKGCI